VSDREVILARLPDPIPEGSKSDSRRSTEGKPRAVAGIDGLWPIFAEKLPALGSRMASIEDMQELAGNAAWIDEDARLLLPNIGFITADIWSCQVGVTLAELAIAESGSLLVANAPGRRRLGSLTGDIHVVLVPKDRIVATLEEGLARIPERSCALITGSSRTADIEGVLVRGVHGPGEVWVIAI
jgi:L-lactate utilization protein LutB